MSFYDNYVYLCNRAGKTPSAVAIEIGLSKPAVHRWKNGGVPTDATAHKVARYFNVAPAVLLNANLAKEHGFYAEGTLLRDPSVLETKKPADQKVDGLRGAGYYDLTPENRAMIDSLIDSLLKSQSAE